LLTSLRPQTLGIYDLATNFRQSRPGAVTLPEFFKNNGYHTAGLGKVFHVGHGNHEDEQSWSVPHFKVKSIGYALKENQGPTREGALFENKNPADLPRGAAFENADVPDNAYGDGQIADEAVRRLEQARARPDQPFFLAVGFVKPHLPFCAPKKYWDLYDRNAIALPELKTAPQGAPEFAPQYGGELRQYKNIPPKGPLDDDLTRTLIHGYYAATSYMDAQLGRVLGALEASSLAQNTIVVLWGDHGWHLGDHSMWCKHTNYQQATRIPVIILKPGLPAGLRTQAFLESVDLYPTIAELAGLKAPEGLDGLSQAEVLNDPAKSVRSHITHVYPRGGGLLGRAVRTNRYRMVEWKKPGAATDTAVYELYDYEVDPLESRNIAADRPLVLAELKQLLELQPEARPPLAAAAKAGNDRQAMFTRRDKNNDGQLTREEFLANQPDPDQAPRRFTTFDANQDGRLSRDEFVNQGRVPARP
jgi:iduronate 2-sulfatase